MRSWILPVIFSALLAALALVVNAQAKEIERLTNIIYGSREPGRDAVEQEDGDEVRGVTARVASLEAELSAFRSRLGRCEIALRERDDRGFVPGPSATDRAHGATAADPKQVEYTLLDLLDAEQGDVRERLRDVITEEREAERDKRMERREQRRRERTRAALDQLAEKVGLDDEVRQGVEGLLQAEWDRLREIFQAARAEGGFRQARDKALAVRRETDDQVRELVDQRQYQAYLEMREQELPRGMGRRGGPPVRRTAPRE